MIMKAHLKNKYSFQFLLLDNGNNNDSLFVTKEIKISQVSQHSFLFQANRKWTDFVYLLLE